MKTALFVLSMGALLCVQGTAEAQKKPAPKSLAQLELTMEVATTSDDGYPTVVRITLKNVGATTVDMPNLQISCMPDGGIEVQTEWTPDDRKSVGEGWGHSCGRSDSPSLLKRIKQDWLRLRSGEFITVSESIRDRISDLKSGTLEYWAEYIPPRASAKELADVQQAGYIIPTEDRV